MKFTLAIAALVASTSAVSTWWTAAPNTSLVGVDKSFKKEIKQFILDKAVDYNDDGHLTCTEIKIKIQKYFTKNDLTLPHDWEETVNDVCNNIDKNGNGRISKKEFLNA